MIKRVQLQALFLAALFLAAGCSTRVRPLVDRESVRPGTMVARGDARYRLLGIPAAVGKPLHSSVLVDAMTMAEVDLARERGRVLLLSIVPSIDTPVCEFQTHYLGEEGDRLPASIRRITISRDTPFAQKRFARAAGLTDIQFLSDYKIGDFGRAHGLLMGDIKLLARAVLVVDKKGIVRYVQVVPDITHLPDLEEAFRQAIMIDREE